MFKLEFNREHLWQWDLNQRLILTGVDIGVSVHFSSPFIDHLEEALPVETYEEDGVVYADIPNIILQTSGYFKAFVYTCKNPDRGEAHTITSISVEVKERKKPATYVYTETEIGSYESLKERIENLENRDDVVSDEQIESAVDKYFEKNPIDTGVDFTTDGTLKLEDGVLSVNTTNKMEQDNTLPMTSAGVFATVGNIEALLKTI